MTLEIARIGAPALRITGSPSLVQGVYGRRGNLELMACDAASGLWVFWCNADEETDPSDAPEVPPGGWSDGLRFADDTRYRDAQILQSTLGPDHLEVLALTDAGVLESWYWSPGPGFRRRADTVGEEVAAFAATHDRGTVTVTLLSTDSVARSVSSSPAGYPTRDWRPSSRSVSPPADAIGILDAAGVDAATVAPGTARAVLTTRHGGTIELTWRDRDGVARHTALPA